MIIGKIDFSRPNRKFPKCDMDLYNLKNCLYDYTFEKKHVVITCRFCGRVLAPCVEHMGPREAGWERLGKHWWLCHPCVYHGGPWYGTEEERKEFRDNVRKDNLEIRKMLNHYKLTHPWVRFKKL